MGGNRRGVQYGANDISWAFGGLATKKLWPNYAFSASGRSFRATGLQRFYASIGVSEPRSSPNPKLGGKLSNFDICDI